MYKHFLKRIIDLILSILGLVLISPVFLMTMILLGMTNQGTVFFIQHRPGKKGQLLKIIKFKTMTDKKDIHGNPLPDSKRLTPVGKFLRKISLDEIPQLLNVIKGDMSLIGPRPLLVEYLPLYDEEQKRRHEIRPGITGWAQVNGRNAISWTEKFRLDVWYVDHVSFLLDLRILIKTVKKVCLGEGINSNTSVTMGKFEGNLYNQYKL